MKIMTFDEISRLGSMYYLNKAINESRLLVESYPNVNSLLLEAEEEAPYEWDFVNNKFYDRVNGIETDIKKSASYVKTAEQGIDFIKTLVTKVAELPDKLKSRFIKVAIASMALTMGYNQLVAVDNNITTNTPEAIMVSKILDTELAKKNKDDEITINPTVTPKEVEPRYMTNPDAPYSDGLVNFLKNEEGSAKFKGEPATTAYALGDGMVTIGYGHAEPITGTKGKHKVSKTMVSDITKISKSKAEELLLKDIKENAGYVMRLIVDKIAKQKNGVKITQPMFDAMVSLSFNHGIGNLVKSDFVKALKAGNIKKASELIKNLGTGGNFNTSISNRREKERKMFNGNYPT